MKSFTAGPNENGVRLSRFVEGVTRDMPRSMMYKAFRNKRIKVNGKRAEPDTRLNTGDLIELYINDEFFPVGKPAAKTAKPPRRQPPVTVVYEDENFAVLYKPAHLLCHSDRTGDANLVDAFAAYLEAKGEYDPHAEKRFAPALCNRLDRGTEGLVLAAKSYAALRDLNAIIRDDMMKKEYLTITVGGPLCGLVAAQRENQQGAHPRPGKRGLQADHHRGDGHPAGRAVCALPHRADHGPHPSDPCASGVSGTSGTGRHQVRQPQDERAHRAENTGSLRPAADVWPNPRGKYAALSFRQGHQAERSGNRKDV